VQQLIFFLGRFHVLALHLPIGIIVVAVVLDFAARRRRFGGLAPAAPFLWGAAALSAVLTVVLGYMHFAEGGFAGPSGDAHRVLGTSTALVTLLAWWLATRRDAAAWPRLVVGVLALGLVTVTGHYGGNLTHGPSFLIQYAPRPLRTLLGLEPGRARPASLAQADPYLDVVQPLLARRCGTCHGGDKREGSFSIATYESTLAGGDTGLAVSPGDLPGSELYYRITLPADDEKHMPAEGKTPPTSDQIAILRWWIEKGAPHGTTIGELAVEPAVESLLAAELGLNPVAESPGSSGAATEPVSADAELVTTLASAGFLVRQVSQSDPRLAVAVGAPGMELGAAQRSALALAATEIVDLNLQNANVDDAMTAALAVLTQLVNLRLSGASLTDRGVASLAGLSRLEHLNLYANPGVTDASIDALGRLAALRRVDVWQTGISEAGIARLRKLRPELLVQGSAAASLREPAAAGTAAPAAAQ
jgi:uncharacterized membrane protein